MTVAMAVPGSGSSDSTRNSIVAPQPASPVSREAVPEAPTSKLARRADGSRPPGAAGSAPPVEACRQWLARKTTRGRVVESQGYSGNRCGLRAAAAFCDPRYGCCGSTIQAAEDMEF